MKTLLEDVRYGLRTLLKRPGFFAVAVLTLGLGIGANSAIFSTVNAVLLRPLSFPDSESLVLLEGVHTRQGITQSNMSVPDIVDWQNQNQSFEQIAAFVTGGVLMMSNEETERVLAAGVSGDFFPLMRTNAALGRTLQPDDARKGHDNVAVLSYGQWQKRFGGDPGVIGRQVMISGDNTTIVGVMPAGFEFPQQMEVWVPLTLDSATERRDNRAYNVVARLKPGVTIEQAQADINAIDQRLAQTYVETNSGWSTRITNLRERTVTGLRTSLLVLLGAVAMVLLIACANVANLLLARVATRQKEMAVRTALGASRWRIVRQLLTESLLLSIIGGIAGFGLSVWLTRLLIAVSPPNTPRFDEIGIDARVFLFTLGITLITGLVFGVAPAFQASRLDLNQHLKESGRRGSGGESHNRLGSLLIVSEIALSFMLLVGAGLLVKSFMRLSEVNPGFNPNNLLTMRIGLTPGKYPQGEPRAQLFRQAAEKIKSVPGVEAAGGALFMPLGGDTLNVGRSWIREGRPFTPEESANATYRVITPDYFRALQAPVVAGRAFTDQDNNDSLKVVIINEKMARLGWPGESPIGKRITIWRDEKFPREIVGVVGDTKASLDTEVGAQMYVPYSQDAGWGSLTFVIRTTTGDPASLAPAVRNEIRSLDKSLPVYNVKTMDDVLAASVADRRTSMLLFSTFAVVAILLSMIGIYGVTAYYVTQRTHEIGIRMALGAQLRDVLTLILKRGVALALIGLGVGLAGAFALTRLLTTLLFGVKPVDVMTFAIGSVCVIAVAVLACYVPARRATKVNPLVALRYE
ncbi:MAG TPA: ABC transporter permease [Pyrinomonadaceae bacterium]|nr:ABC transporter permease [Pyrinomonadaceae bacterium]